MSLSEIHKILAGHIRSHRLLTCAVNRELKALWFKNSRTAGTSMYRGILKNSQTGWITEKDETADYHRWLEDIYTGREDLTHYGTWTFVRNPWERILSVYMRFHGELFFCDFDTFIIRRFYGETTKLLVDTYPQYNAAYTRAGIRISDFIGRFENLKHDWAIVAKSLGVPEDLPHENQSYHGHYSQYYNAQTRDIISKIYAREIKKFNYRFEDHE